MIKHPIHLRSAGVSVVFGADARGIPFVLHWGAELPDADAAELAATAGTAELHSAIDSALTPTVVPSGADGWSGTPGAEWHADGVAPAAMVLESAAMEGARATFELTEPRTGARLRLDYELTPGGVLAVAAELVNGGASVIDVGALRMLLPLPDRAREIEDQSGYWSGERKPQRLPLRNGSWDRSNRRGRTGHDSPILTAVGTPGFGFRHGELWSVHLAWSGDAQVLVERLPEGAGPLASMLGAAELLAPGEVRLAPSERYRSPTAYFVWSDRGLDGATARLHGLVRSFPRHPATPRPVVLNTWEAVYFDHDATRLAQLVEAAAQIGVERFVLDDGWFLGRRHDRAGLGDWVVDPAVWPRGLRPLADLVHASGMEFGLWFEPEMVNPDSDLAREHPEWLLLDEAGARLPWRGQYALNLGIPEAWQRILEQISAVVAEAGVDFIKWDHNRDLHEPIDRGSGRVGVHRQTDAVYRLIDALLERHPGLEIESCASGGGRVDLGILQRTHRVWASDTIDPLERQAIQRGTATILPLEYLGAHVGAARAHTTGRVASLAFRLGTALFGHAGLEQDVTRLSAEERAAVAVWIALYKELRPLLHGGELVRADDVPEGALLTGVLSPEREHAVYSWVQLEAGPLANVSRVRLPGLDTTRRYELRLREDFGRAGRRSHVDPAWLLAGALTASGATLALAGVPLPALAPQEALLLELRAV